ncbi:MAG: hypothetical protein ACRDRZ_06820 [Pseudonocardiaceae bacterium]
MSLMAAALVLAWICLVLLALAMAGLLRQVRELQADVAELSTQGSRPLVGRRVDALATGSRTVLLVLAPGCGFCEPAYRTAVALAGDHPDTRFEALSFRAVDWPTSPAVAVRVDERLFAELDVPWAPALLIADTQGTVVAARPIQSTGELRSHLADLLAHPQPVPPGAT